jgi:hypothetical protein
VNHRPVASRLALAVCASTVVAACSVSARPMVYPNAHLNEVGTDQAEADINECIRRADAYGATTSSKAGEMAEGAAKGAAIGAAAGAVGGAITGRAGRGAAVGAAACGTSGLLRNWFRIRQPDDAHKRFVERCLRDMGYDPIAWK